MSVSARRNLMRSVDRALRVLDDDPYEMDRRFDVKVEYLDKDDGRVISTRAFKARSGSEASQKARAYYSRSDQNNVRVLEVTNSGPASMMGSNFKWDN